MYTEKELVRIAKRENNNKRKYLVVNRLQGKHIPVKPGECLAMFDALAGVAAKAYGDETILLIGFAETATAIGARLAADMDCYYMQTTREEIEGVEYLYFTESHSHATEQKLVKTDLDQIMGKVQRVVFAEDEVTTGNTILGIVSILREVYGKDKAFAVVSVLNGMDGEAEEVYAKQGIALHYLVKTDHSGYTDKAEAYRGDGIYHGCPAEAVCCPGWSGMYRAGGYVNARRLLKGAEYQAACEVLYGQVGQWLTFAEKEKALVLGTEEFMYPAVYVASKLEEAGRLVKCHSTTRSPIAVSMEENYPLHVRYELHSPYEDGRRTFLYDLGKYDKVIVLTDACHGQGLGDLCSHLRECGNDEVYLVRWCE